MRTVQTTAATAKATRTDYGEAGEDKMVVGGGGGTKIYEGRIVDEGVDFPPQVLPPPTKTSDPRHTQDKK